MVKKRKAQQGLRTDTRAYVGEHAAIYKQPGSDYWYTDITLPSLSKPVRKTTKLTDINDAAEFCRQLVRDLIANPSIATTLTAKSVNRTVADAILGLKESFKTDRRFVNKPKLLQSEENALDRLAPYWKDTLLRHINEQAIDQWRLWRSQQPNRQGTTKRFGNVSAISDDKLKERKLISVGTIKREYALIRAALEWAYLNKWLPTRINVKLSFKGRDYEDDDIPRAMPDDAETKQLEAWLNMVLNYPRAPYEAVLAATWIATLLYSGVRPTNETEDMRWSDIGWNGQFVTIFVSKGKTGARRTQAWPELKPFFERLRELQEDIHTVNDTDHIWKRENGAKINSFTRHFDAALQSAGITRTDLVPYSLRHRYLTDALVKGVPSLELALNAGTSEEMLRKHYTHLNDKDITAALMKAKH